MPNTDPQAYSPKYVEIDDIPITGPDEYEATAKRRALYTAEATFELDVNNGLELDMDDLTNAHRSAVQNLGTHILTHGATSPSSTTLGDMADSGSQRGNYSSHFMEEYDRLIERINQASGAHGSNHGRNTSVSVNTRNGDRMERRYPFNRDARWPDDR